MITLTYIAWASCENDDLIYFAHLFEEIVDPGSLDHPHCRTHEKDNKTASFCKLYHDNLN